MNRSIAATPDRESIGREQWRSLLRSRRRMLSRAERRRAEQRILQHLTCSGLLIPGRSIALYVSVASEVSTGALIELAQARGCRIYLPRIADYAHRTLQFAALSPGMRLNRHGIPEPRAQAARVAPRHLSTLFVPLLGFDAQGGRLGSGAGYYDRALAQLSARDRTRRTRLVGLAFACQQVPSLPILPHDVPLDAVCTELGLMHRQPDPP
ncbi:MAG: 5-formyltetrahydrofolate cyclo-ligase [Steroidobacteraceae bacterium]